MRFARLRLEKRHNYVRKVAELATQLFITDDRPNIRGLVLAGSAGFKTELQTSDLFDPRLNKVVVKMVSGVYLFFCDESWSVIVVATAIVSG